MGSEREYICKLCRGMPNGGSEVSQRERGQHRDHKSRDSSPRAHSLAFGMMCGLFCRSGFSRRRGHPCCAAHHVHQHIHSCVGLHWLLLREKYSVTFKTFCPSSPLRSFRHFPASSASRRDAINVVYTPIFQNCLTPSPPSDSCGSVGSAFVSQPQGCELESCSSHVQVV